MKKPLDRVTEAYFDEMGPTFGKKVRDRIHWICEQVEGSNVLDVGCSQGILAILLGREGKRVLGLDLLDESITYANKALNTESQATKEIVKFEVGNFMTYDFQEEKFDTIVMGEILEHVSNPKPFIEHAKKLLNPNGKIIVTVPFGINDYFDHKQTYYLYDLLSWSDEEFSISSIKFFGKWIGAVYQIGSSQVELNNLLLESLEQTFYSVERKLIKQIENKNKEIAELKEVIEDKDKKSNLLTRDEITNLLSKFDQNFEEVKDEIKELKDFSINGKEEEISKSIIQDKVEKVIIKQELFEAFNREESLLQSYKKLLGKYEALSNSKLGGLALYYWRFKKRLRRGK